MYTVRMAIECGDLPEAEGDARVQTALAIEDVVGAAVLRYFRRVTFESVAVEARDQRGAPTWMGVLVCRCPDDFPLVSPNRLEEAEAMLADYVRGIWFRRFRSTCAPEVRITYVLPTDEWDEVLREIA